MVTLRVVVDSVVEGSPRGIARYTEELTRALIQTAPRDCQVEGVIAASPEPEAAQLLRRLPGLAALHRAPLGRRELYAAWQRGMSSFGVKGMVHSTTLLAPLRRHDRLNHPGQQTVVTIHDASPWIFTETGERAAWARAMAKRAHRHADAIIVPSHAVAADLAEYIDFGERVRVIGGAVRQGFAVPEDADRLADELALPTEYLLTVATLEPRKGLEALLHAAARADFPDIPLLVVGPASFGARTMTDAVADAHPREGRVRHLGLLSDEQLAVALDRAAAFVLPSLSEGFGLTAVEAFSLGTPVIHSDAPALLEVADGAGVAVPREPAENYPERLARAIATTLADAQLLERLRISALDRSHVFSWRDSAEKVWQLHADL